VFVAPKKMWLTLDAGTFEKITYNRKTNSIEITLNSKDEFTPNAYLRVNNDIELPYTKVRGAYQIPLQKKSLQIKL
jgi:hypothetical protein